MFLTKASSLFQHQNQTIHTGVKSFLEFKRQMLPKYHLELGKTKLSQSLELSLTGSQQSTSFPLYKNTSDMFSKISLIYTNNQQLTKLTYHKMKSRLLESSNRWRMLSSNLQIRVVQSWKTLEHITEEQSLQNLWPKQPILALRQNKNLHDQLVHTNFKSTANNLSETHQ